MFLHNFDIDLLTTGSVRKEVHFSIPQLGEIPKVGVYLAYYTVGQRRRQ